MVCQGLDATEAADAWHPFFTWVRAAAEDFDIIDELGTAVIPSRHWWDVMGNPAMIPDWRPGTPALPWLVERRLGTGGHAPARL